MKGRGPYTQNNFSGLEFNQNVRVPLLGNVASGDWSSELLVQPVPGWVKGIYFPGMLPCENILHKTFTKSCDQFCTHFVAKTGENTD